MLCSGQHNPIVAKVGMLDITPIFPAMDTFIELLRLGAVGVIAGLFSAYIATRAHRNKRWWELRVSAYQSVIEALSDLTHYYERNYRAEIVGQELTDEYKAELDKFWDDSYHKIRRAADSGAFLFSDDVNRALKDFMDLNQEAHQTYIEYL